MSFPQYPKYKDSRVGWLGRIPEHWSVLPCRAIVSEKTAKNEDAQCTDYLSLVANVGVIPYAEKGDVGNKKPEDLSKCKMVTKGDFVINSMNYGIGSYGLSDYDGVCSPVYIVLKPRNDVVESRFAFRIFENRTFQTLAQSFGNGILEHRCAISWDILKSIGVPVPPMREQQEILAFLDREIARIDALVAEQRRLIELLEEKRQAVISDAVTKGLNRQPSMKDSGIEWLGCVPAHWKVGKCGFYVSVLSGFAFPSAGFSESVDHTKLLRGINLGVGQLRWDEVVYWQRTADDGLDEYELRAGDLVIGMDRPLIGEGMRVAKVQAADVPCLLLQRVAKLIPDSKLDTDYLFQLLSSEMFIAHFSPDTTGVSVPHISPEQICDFVIPIPPIDEQREIVRFVAAETERVDSLIQELRHAINLLQERRAALISAAVTGQIDVRQLAEKQAAA